MQWASTTSTSWSSDERGDPGLAGARRAGCRLSPRGRGRGTARGAPGGDPDRRRRGGRDRLHPVPDRQVPRPPLRRRACRRARPGRPEGGHGEGRAHHGRTARSRRERGGGGRGDRLSSGRRRPVPAGARGVRCSSTARSSDTPWCGPARAPIGTSSACRRPSSCASRAVASRTSCSNHHNPKEPARTEETRCRRPRRSG